MYFIVFKLFSFTKVGPWDWIRNNPGEERNTGLSKQPDLKFLCGSSCRSDVSSPPRMIKRPYRSAVECLYWTAKEKQAKKTVQLIAFLAVGLNNATPWQFDCWLDDSSGTDTSYSLSLNVELNYWLGVVWGRDLSYLSKLTDLLTWENMNRMNFTLIKLSRSVQLLVCDCRGKTGETNC